MKLIIAIWLALTIVSAAQERSTDIHVDVSLVQVPVSVTNRDVPVKGLQKTDFQLREDSQLQEIKYLWQEADLPLSIGLLVDVSGSQLAFLHSHKNSVLQFLRTVLRPEDRAMIVSVGRDVWLNAELTNSLEDLERGLNSVGDRRGRTLGESCGVRVARRRARPICGGTVLWNAVYFASRLKLRQVPGRKALLILSDGLDTGSNHNLTSAIEAAQSAGVAVYSIKSVIPVLAPVAAVRQGMEKLSEETGGAGFGMLHGNLDDVFRKIEEELRQQYVLAYTSTNTAHDGTYRKLEISLPGRRNLQIRARKGYWATE